MWQLLTNLDLDFSLTTHVYVNVTEFTESMELVFAALTDNGEFCTPRMFEGGLSLRHLKAY